MTKQWRYRGFDAAAIQHLAKTAGVETVVAQLLFQRGITDPGFIQTFLEPKFSELREPLLLPNMGLASERIYRAVQDRIPIVVYGDYDADGMCGTAILYNCLKMLRADVQYYIPNRLEDSYGLSCEALSKLHQRGRRLVISVDCGIGSVAEASHCRELGLELIVTDHHTIGETLPDASAIVHPALPDFGYPFHGLCGGGVAFKLAWALCQLDSQDKRVTPAHRQFLLESTCIAAIATVADVVPLVDENRIIVRSALKLLLQNAPLGLKALMERAKLHTKSSLAAEDIAFTLAPRLNAAGRLGQAQLGVELLTTQDPERAKALAEYLDRLNSDRESLERSVTLAATKQIKEQFDVENDPALVVHGAGWHLGVIGVVAGRLAEKFHRPVVVVGLDPLGQKPGTGSARSAGVVNLYEAFQDCREHLVSCGGHAAAAGLKIQEHCIPSFRAALLEAVATRLGGTRPSPILEIDAEVTLKQISSLSLVQRIERLAPFGASNPRPIFVANQVQLTEPAKTMGNGDRHFQARFVQHGTAIRAIAFGQSEWVETINQHPGSIDIAFRPNINEFGGNHRVELQVMDWRRSPSSVPAPHVLERSNISTLT
jgi:single-stranded-DNA-specific exonuclease